MAITNKKLIGSPENLALHIVDAARAAGIEVPEGLASVVEAYRLKPSLPSAQEARNAVYTARSQEELDKAAHGLALATAVATATSEAPFLSSLNQARSEALRDALRSHLGDLRDAAVDGFNDAAPAFVAAVEVIPDLASTDAFDLSTDAIEALHTARGAIEPLKRFYAVHEAITVYSGDSPTDPARPGGAERIVARFGDFEDQEQADQAADLVRRYGHGDPSLKLSSLAPFVAIPRVGATLRLK